MWLFDRCRMQHTVLVVNPGSFVWLSCSAWIYVHLFRSFFFCGVVCLFWMFHVHFTTSNFVPCSLLYFFSDNSSPFHTDLCFLTTCLTVFELEDILLRAVLLVMLFCSLFVPLYVLFCLLVAFDNFLAPTNLFVFAFLLVFFGAIWCSYLSICMRGTWSPSKPAPFRYMFYGCPVMARSLLVGDLPVYMFVTMKHHFVIFGSLYLVFRAECAHVSPTPIRTHLHAPDPFFVPLCPTAHICLFGKFPRP